MSTPEKQNTAPRKRIGLWILSATGVVFASALIALPYIVKFQAIKWVEKNGADKAYIEDVDLNLFAGTFQVDNLVIQKQNETPLRIWQLAGDFNWLDLFKKRAVVQTLWLYGGHLSVVQDEKGGLTIGGITLPKAEATKPAEPSAAPALASDWAFGVTACVLANTTVEYHGPNLSQDLYATVIYVLNMHSWEPGSPAQVGVDMRINNQPFKVSSGVRAFADDPDTAAELDLEGLNLADFAALARLANVEDLTGKLSLKLALDAVQRDGEQTRLDVRGDVTLRDLRANYGDMRLDQGLLHYTGAAKVHLNGPVDVPMVEVDGQWKSNDSTFSLGEMRIEHAGLNWKTATKLFVSQAENEPPRIATQGEGTVDGLVVEDGKQQMRLANVRHIAVKGLDAQLPDRVAVKDISLGQTTALESMATDGSASAMPEVSFEKLRLRDVGYDFGEKSVSVLAVDVAKVKARDKTKGLVLSDVGAVEVSNIELALAEGLTIKGVKVSDLGALRPESSKKKSSPALIMVGKTTVEAIAYTFEPARLDVGSVGINGLMGNFVREKDGTLYGLAQLTAGGEREAEPTTKQVAATAPMTLRLGSLKIDDNAEIHWTDNFVKPSVATTVKPLSLTVGTLDTAEPRAKTKVDFLASLHKNNQIKFKGHISPLDPKPNSQVDGTIKSLELTNFASYAAAAGYTLRSGRLDADVTAKVTEGQLDMLNKLVVTKLRLEGGGGEAKRDGAAAATALPLNVALGYLRDSNDQIKLDIPVTGDVRDPQFSFRDVFRLATQAAAQQAAMSYVTAALQPLGTALLVGKLVGKAASAMQLQAIEFEPGDAVPDEKARAYAEKIAGILNGRPGVKLTVCGNATQSDRAALLAKLQEEQKARQEKDAKKEAQEAQPQSLVGDEVLLKLADERGKQIRDVLVDTHKVSPDQLFDCRPVLEADPATVPSVTLGI